MPRRASSSAHPLWLLAAGVLVVAAIAGGLLIRSQGDPFRTVAALPVKDYLDNSNSLRGNIYKLDATIAKSIDWSANAGRLFAVESTDTSIVPVSGSLRPINTTSPVALSVTNVI